LSGYLGRLKNYPALSRGLKFVELAGKRVANAIKDIRLIGNLSNKSNYSYADEDVKKNHQSLGPGSLRN